MNPTRAKFGVAFAVMLVLTLVFATIPGMGAVATVCGLLTGSCLLIAMKG